MKPKKTLKVINPEHLETQELQNAWAKSIMAYMLGYHGLSWPNSNSNHCPKNPTSDNHAYVNQGFNTIVMACKHCNQDKPKSRIQGDLKIGKKYIRSDNGKEVQIVAEKQGSGYLSEYEYFLLGSDGKMYKKDGEVTRYDEDTTWDTRNSKEPNDWFLTEGN